MVLLFSLLMNMCCSIMKKKKESMLCISFVGDSCHDGHVMGFIVISLVKKSKDKNE